jgi:hypothetical protein
MSLFGESKWFYEHKLHCFSPLTKAFSPRLSQTQDMCQNLKMSLLPSAFSLLWGVARGVTAHDAVHDAAHDAFVTLPPYNT